MMNAYEKLGLIIGEEVEDDLADRIFEKFCMGKIVSGCIKCN